MTRDQRVQQTLLKVARLYDLVAEMRTIIAELRACKVDVRLGADYDHKDPLHANAVIHVTLLPGCDRIEP